VADGGSEVELRQLISTRVRELAVLAGHNARGLRKKAKVWRRVGMWASLVAVGLAAAAGATGLSDVLSKELVAYLAIASAVLTAINSGLGATSTAEAEQKAAFDFFVLQSDADMWRELHLPSEPIPDAKKKLEELLKQRNEALELSAAASYYLAKRDKAQLDSVPAAVPTSGSGESTTSDPSAPSSR
jgi:hypothetical protein